MTDRLEPLSITLALAYLISVPLVFAYLRRHRSGFAPEDVATNALFLLVAPFTLGAIGLWYFVLGIGVMVNVGKTK